MAEDGLETACKTSSDTMHSSGAGSIVSNLLRKSSGYREGMMFIGGGLEQKIQELRAEKEAGEMIKCPTSIHNDQDSPIDFSVKRRSSFSGSLTDDSQASLCSPGNATDYSAMSPAVDSESANHSGDVSKRSTPSPHSHRFEDQKLFSQPDFQVSPLLQNPPITNGLGMFSGLSSGLLGNGSTINTFSQMAAAASFVDPRSKKNNRPFKAYPKEALQMPLGFFGLPGLTPAAVQKGIESGIFSGMSSEDIVNLYNRQLHVFKEKQLSLQEGSTSPPSFVSAPSRTNTPRHHTHHHHQNSHQETSSSLPYPSTNISISPPLLMSDHGKSNNTPATNFPVPVTSGSVNTTVVSSTSSSFSHSNSRKRPRSLPDDQKDAAYWERRRKNNDAAKRSRDARRAKEDEIAIRAALLEQENIKLRVEVAALKTETARLRCLLYNN